MLTWNAGYFKRLFTPCFQLGSLCPQPHICMDRVTRLLIHRIIVAYVIVFYRSQSQPHVMYYPTLKVINSSTYSGTGHPWRP